MQDDWHDTPAGQERARADAEIERLRALLERTRRIDPTAPQHVTLSPRPTLPVLHETPFGWHAHADRSELDASLELAPAGAVRQRNTGALREAYGALAFLSWIWQLRAAAKAIKDAQQK